MKNCITLFCLLVFISSLSAQATANDLVKRLQDEYRAQIWLHPSTGQARFIRFSANSQFQLSGVDNVARAWDFLQQFSGLWELDDPATSFQYQNTETDLAGNTHLSFLQNHGDIAVFDGELKFHFNRRSELQAVSGLAVACQDLPAEAQVSAELAIQTARVILQKEYKVNYQSLAVPKLMVFHRGLAQGIAGRIHLTYELLLGDGSADRQYVYIDAIDGEIVERFPANCSLLDREIYNGNTNGSPVWSEGDAYPGSLTAAQQTLTEVTEQTYYMFFHAFGYDSFDGSGSTMKSVADATNVSCPNATWNGVSTNFCTGFAHDDIVAHEWGHAYTEYTNNLIYAWQAGAINEAYSDIWGETVDLLNNYDIDVGEGTVRTACDSSPRWELGEGLNNALRDMWMPSCNNDPNNVTASNYWCTTGDSGGVHTNSGIPNHAYALLVDGGTFNGETVSALGFVKAAHVFWQAQSQYLSRTSDFSILAAALQSACTDLLGVDLPDLGFTATDPGLSGQIISAADCVEVDDAIAAVEMAGTPDCMFLPLLDANTPSICAMNDFQTLYSIDFESGSTGWTATEIPTNPTTWTSRNWSLDSSLPDNRSGQAMFGPDPVFGDCSSDLDNGIIQLESPAIVVPADFTAPLYLSFDHYVSMELGWDGGIIQYQIDGGSWVDVMSSDFTFNAYNQSLNTAGQGNDNPLASKSAFTGADGGSVTSTWGTSHLHIGNQADRTIRFRWQLGVDGCNGWDGWYIDDVLVGGCTSQFLPVRWADFSVMPINETAHLQWTTEQEESNAGFWVERSLEPRTGFTPLDWLSGQGTTHQRQTYEYYDRSLHPGLRYYYRLRQVDFDGTEGFSPLRECRLPGQAKDAFVVFPNPVQGEAQLQWLGAAVDELAVSVYRLDGRLVQRAQIDQQVDTGQLIPLDLSGFSSGIYLVVVRTEWGEVTRAKVLLE